MPIVGWMEKQAEGAYPNGTKIVKVQAEEGDIHPVGTKGTVIGSIKVPEQEHIGYFVKWEKMEGTPVIAEGMPVFVVGWKIGPAPEEKEGE